MNFEPVSSFHERVAIQHRMVRGIHGNTDAGGICDPYGKQPFPEPSQPVVVTILYTILKYILEKDKQIIAALEQELMILESIPLKNRPTGFLETNFYLRKEVNQPGNNPNYCLF